MMNLIGMNQLDARDCFGAVVTAVAVAVGTYRAVSIGVIGVTRRRQF